MDSRCPGPRCRARTRVTARRVPFRSRRATPTAACRSIPSASRPRRTRCRRTCCRSRGRRRTSAHGRAASPRCRRTCDRARYPRSPRAPRSRRPSRTGTSRARSPCRRWSPLQGDQRHASSHAYARPRTRRARCARSRDARSASCRTPRPRRRTRRRVTCDVRAVDRSRCRPSAHARSGCPAPRRSRA